MTTRKERRITQENEPKMKKGAKKQLIIMIIAIVLMVFSVTQVYHLTRYTLGYPVQEHDLRVYKWVSMLLN